MTVDQPIKTFNQKIGLNIVHPEGKEAITKFRKLHSDGQSSVVECTPITGRTHQIRVHLQYLGMNYIKLSLGTTINGSIGFPIVNDPIYNNDQWGPNGGKGGLSDTELAEIVIRFDDSIMTHDKMAAAESLVLDVEDDICPDCAHPFPDPSPQDLTMWLHALTYKGPGWSFETALPSWATKDFDAAEYTKDPIVWQGGTTTYDRTLATAPEAV